MLEHDVTCSEGFEKAEAIPGQEVGFIKLHLLVGFEVVKGMG